MKNGIIPMKENHKLRQKAERLLDQANDEAQELAGMPPEEVAKLVHELRVHQIELKMQNDELRRIQAELEKARDRYVHLYDFAPTAYLTVDEKDAVAEANLTAATLLERPRSALVGMMFSRFVHRDDQDVWYLHRKRLLETGDFQAFQIRLVKNDGDMFYVTLECMLVEESQSGLKAIRISATEITELKEAEEKLRQSEEKYRTLFESLDAGCCVIEMRIEPDQPLDYRFIEINKAFERQSTLTNAKGKWMRDLRPDHEESWFEIYRDVALTGQPVWFEHFGRELNNRWFALNAFRIGPAQQQRVAVLFYDITDRKKAEEALQHLNAALEQQVAERTALAEGRAKQLQSMAIELIETEERERRRFADLLHEDLQQMLASARFQLQAVSVDKSADPKLQPVIRILEESIAKSRRLTHELSPPVMHHGSLSSAMEWLSGQMNEHFGLNVHLEAENIPEVKNSSVKVFIFRAVQELLFNIVKHAGVKNANILLSGKDSHLDVTVSDQGKGFDKEELDRSKTKKGYGLISIRERARYIGGDLKIESQPGQGSSFYLTVPVQPAIIESVHVPTEAPPFDAVAPKNSAGTGGLRVLFADDHKVMREGLIRLVSSQPDIQVAGEAANGREVVEFAQQLRPDVIVMDISMPEMDGIEATRRIKAEMPEVRIVGLSMFEDKNSAQGIINAGADCFVPKTASSAELLKAIYGSSD
jgi:PAS domain S-box-containing protein